MVFFPNWMGLVQKQLLSFYSFKYDLPAKVDIFYHTRNDKQIIFVHLQSKHFEASQSNTI